MATSPPPSSSPSPLPVASPRRPRRFRRWAILILFIILVVPALGVAGWTWLTLHVSYSTGERVGYIQKISKKGWMCKTWEGELAMVNIPGTTPQMFEFSVSDEKIARQIMDAPGQRVALSYSQHKGVPTNCFGDTEYYITAVRVVGQ